ncbi:MAG TPA: serine/threonine-protein kinase [Archangium sp.]|nr:serine/threonine-protein kinase [Archangium sp.]
MGQQLGEYRVRRCIGRGGMGIVYEAEHMTLGRRVALKLLREEHARSPYARDLLSEARAASAIQHRGIIDVFGFGEQPGIGQYLVMEYLEGQPLHELIAQRAPLTPAEVIQLLGEVLDALSAAHAQGVIHRDLKPSNIFVVREADGSQYVKVLDFGLAKRINAPATLASRSDIIVGTPHYMAPEQALCEAVGPGTDLYAVGVIAFEMLTRRRLFPGRSNLEMVAHHLKSPPPRPSLYVVLPPGLEDLILRLLAKEPQQRPASASAAARELRALLQAGDSSVKPAQPPLLSQAKYAPTFAFMEQSTLHPASPAEGAVARPPAIPALAPSALPQPRSPRWRRGAVAGVLLVLLGGAGAVIGPTLLERARPVEAPVASPRGLALTPPASPQPVPMASPPPSAQPPPQAAQAKALPRVERLPPATKRTPPPARTRHEPALTASSPAVTPPPAPAVPPATTGMLHVTVKGAWADVWVDGKMLGRVPPMHRYTLTVGEHQLELRNPGLKTRSEKILISPDGILPYTAMLDPVDRPPSPP